MRKLIADPNWTTAQRLFIDSLQNLGAVAAQHAVPIDRTVQPPVQQLQSLVDSGIVREASANGYYLYLAQRVRPGSPEEDMRDRLRDEVGGGRERAMTARVIARPTRNGQRVLKSVLFWIIIILIPIIMIQLVG